MNETLNQRNVTAITVVDEPVVPFKPVLPKKLLVIIMSVLGGVVFGFGLAMACETADTRFSLAWQVPLTLGLPVMATFDAIQDKGTPNGIAS